MKHDLPGKVRPSSRDAFGAFVGSSAPALVLMPGFDIDARPRVVDEGVTATGVLARRTGPKEGVCNTL